MPRLGSRVRIPFPAPEIETRDCGRNACNSGFSFGSQRTVDAVSGRNGHTVESPRIPPKNPHEWQRGGNGLCTCEGEVQDYPKRRAKPAGRRWASIAFDRLCASGGRIVSDHSHAPSIGRHLPRVVPFKLRGLPYEMARNARQSPCGCLGPRRPRRADLATGIFGAAEGAVEFPRPCQQPRHNFFRIFSTTPVPPLAIDCLPGVRIPSGIRWPLESRDSRGCATG